MACVIQNALPDRGDPVCWTSESPSHPSPLAESMDVIENNDDRDSEHHSDEFDDDEQPSCDSSVTHQHCNRVAAIVHNDHKSGFAVLNKQYQTLSAPLPQDLGKHNYSMGDDDMDKQQLTGRPYCCWRIPKDWLALFAIGAALILAILLVLQAFGPKAQESGGHDALDISDAPSRRRLGNNLISLRPYSINT